jgi:hypothetical protein
MFSNFVARGNPDPAYMFSYLKYFPFILIIFVAVYYGRFWSVAIGLQEKIPGNILMKVKKFKVFFIIPIAYMLVFFSFFFFSINTLFSNPETNFGLMGALFTLIIPIHLFAMFCIFYTLYFVAKTIKTVELQRAVTFIDFAIEFFLILFYPVGIWIIQPKINKMIEK